MYNNFNGDWKNPKSGKSGDTIFSSEFFVDRENGGVKTPPYKTDKNRRQSGWEGILAFQDG
jgi:hypothetical protein